MEIHLINRAQPKIEPLPFRYYGQSENVRARGLFRNNSVDKQIKAYTHWVYVCVKIRAEAHAKAQFRAYVERTESKKDYLPKEHPAQHILDYPNPYFSKFYFQFLQSIHLDLTGNFYAYVAKDRLGVPRQLFPLPPQNMRAIPGTDPTKLIDHYEFIVQGGEVFPLTFEEVLHIKEPAPGQFINGFSPTQAGALLIDVFNSQLEWQKNFYDKDATPDLTLETDKEISIASKTDFISHWMEHMSGTKRERRMAILDNGMKAHALTLNPKDLQYAETQEKMIHQIFAHFRVPISKAGMVTSGHNRATAEAEDYTFHKDVVDPRLQMIEEQIDVDLMNTYWPNDKLAIKVDHIAMIPDDEARRAEIDKNTVDVTVTRNEIRARDGKLPIEGGDKLYIPQTMVPLGSPVPEVMK